MSDPSVPKIFQIELDGASAPDDLTAGLVEVKVENSLHLPDVATIALHDARLRWVDDGRLMPGKAIKLFAAADKSKRPLFDGEIVELEPAFTQGMQRLVVRAFDRLHRLARGRYVRTFLNLTDGDLIQKVAKEVGLDCELGPMPQVNPYILQANETNLELLQRRAAALGYFLYVDGKTLHCSSGKTDAAPLEITWGAQLHEFHPRLSILGQVNTVTVRGWDPDQRYEVVGQVDQGQGEPEIGERRSGAEVARNAFQVEAPHLVTDRPIRSQAEAERLAQSVANRYAGQFVEAEGLCTGDAAIAAATTVRIRGVGDRFSGDYFVTAVTHHYNVAEGYTTLFSVSGQRPATLLSVLASSRDAAMSKGPAIGIVTDNQDPRGQGRVKVKLPWMSSSHTSDWARLVTPGGGPGRGLQFLPEVNDEVLVGFELGDMQYPYVYGGLWNGQDAPPCTSAEVVSGGKVQQRIIQSRTGHRIVMDDSEGGGGITIKDKNGNQIVLDTSANALNITLKGDATLKSQGKLILEAQGEIEIKGVGIKIDGGAGTVDVKGSLINLN